MTDYNIARDYASMLESAVKSAEQRDFRSAQTTLDKVMGYMLFIEDDLSLDDLSNKMMESYSIAEEKIRELKKTNQDTGI